MQGRLESLT